MSDEYSNLPAGTFDGDPRAPWNECDGDSPEEGDRWCGNCDFFCTIWPEDGPGGDALGYACSIKAEYGDLFDVSDDTTPCAFWRKA